MADIALGSVGKIIDIGLKIKEAVKTVKQNEKECRDTEKCVARVTDIINDFNEAIKRYDEVSPVIQTIKANNRSLHAALEDLVESLEGALDLVTKCQEKNVVRRFFGAGDMARELQLMQDSILRKLTIGSFATIVAQLGITLMSIGQQSAPPHPQNRTEKDETKLATESGEASNNPLSGLINFNLLELEIATDNFSDEKVIGRGGYSTVFKGVLRNGLVVAVKKITYSGRGHSNKTLHNEIKIGGMLQHKNVVKTHGYCLGEKEVLAMYKGHKVKATQEYCILVIGYLPNRSLANIIFGHAEQPIYWPFCFRIIQGIAQGLHYLHKQGIVHVDMKPENILFDSDMNPVIIDFGLSIVLDNEEATITLHHHVMGTVGYIAPEFIRDRVVSTKNDVFSFGLIVLRTIFTACAKVSYEDYMYNGPNIKWEDVDELKEMFDPTLVEESELMEVARCLIIGQLCAEFNSADRPTMAEVLDMLNGEKELPAKRINAQ